MKKITYIILILIIVTVSCKSTNSTKQTLAPNKYVEILSGNHSNFDSPSSVVIKSNKELDDIYATLNNTRVPKYEIPKIDFSKEVVIGLFMGNKNSGGYAINIDRIISDHKYTSILIKETKPTGMTTSVMTQPFYLAKIAKPSTSIRIVTF